MIWLITAPQFPVAQVALPDQGDARTACSMTGDTSVQPASNWQQEFAIITAAFEAGLQTLLLRKPGWPEHAYARWLEQLPARYRARVIVSTYPSLVETFGLKGLHLSEDARARTAPYEIKKLRDSRKWVSTSVHSETGDTSAFDFVLLGPVFDSISKPGYKARHFSRIPVNAIALGGVSGGRIGEIRNRGFRGAAVLGAVWDHPEKAATVIAELLAAWEQMPVTDKNSPPKTESPCHTQ